MAVCAKCQEPLEVEVEVDEEEDDDLNMGGGSSADQSGIRKIPDDTLLPCGCHLHWECLLDTYELDKCPQCSRDITSTSAAGPSNADETVRILVDLNNEGGLQKQIDILPILKEESYLRAYPEERKCRAFLEFCREGDHRAVADLLNSCSNEADDEDEEIDVEHNIPAYHILRYQDPIGNNQSGLMAAAAGGHREVAWLLLLLASNYDELEFPAPVFQEAAALGVMRESQNGKADIRSLKDDFGRTAEDVARETGIIWNGWIGNGRLAMP